MKKFGLLPLEFFLKKSTRKCLRIFNQFVNTASYVFSDSSAGLDSGVDEDDVKRELLSFPEGISSAVFTAFFGALFNSSDKVRRAAHALFAHVLVTRNISDMFAEPDSLIGGKMAIGGTFHHWMLNEARAGNTDALKVLV